MSKYIITDLDGTVCDASHRMPFIANYTEEGLWEPKEHYEKDWLGFNNACIDDVPIEPIVKILKSMHKQGFKIVVCSGRGRGALEATQEWWWKHVVKEIPRHFFLRPENNYIKDDLLKKEWALNNPYIIENTLFVLEDRARVVKMWRSLGLKCLQVDHGDF